MSKLYFSGFKYSILLERPFDFLAVLVIFTAPAVLLGLEVLFKLSFPRAGRFFRVLGQRFVLLFGVRLILCSLAAGVVIVGEGVTSLFDVWVVVACVYVMGFVGHQWYFGSGLWIKTQIWKNGFLGALVVVGGFFEWERVSVVALFVLFGVFLGVDYYKRHEKSFRGFGLQEARNSINGFFRSKRREVEDEKPENGSKKSKVLKKSEIEKSEKELKSELDEIEKTTKKANGAQSILSNSKGLGLNTPKKQETKSRLDYPKAKNELVQPRNSMAMTIPIFYLNRRIQINWIRLIYILILVILNFTIFTRSLIVTRFLSILGMIVLGIGLIYDYFVLIVLFFESIDEGIQEQNDQVNAPIPDERTPTEVLTSTVIASEATTRRNLVVTPKEKVKVAN